MSTNAKGSDGSRKNGENGTYMSLLDSNGSFGSTFWQKDGTNRAASHSNEETWSTAANTSTIDENATSQNDNWSSGNNKKTKKAKRKA